MIDTANPITDVLQTKCKSCGGIMEYSPAHENLKCLYCGYVSELDKTPAEIVENDFLHWKEKADNEVPDESMLEAAEIKCRQCGANTTLPPNVSGAKCAFCATPLIANEAEVKRFWQPEYMLPFKITDKQSGEFFKVWLKKKWFIPSSLKRNAVRPDIFKGVYLPFWTYDANTDTKYSGQRGTYRTERYKNSKGETVERTVTDWNSVSGSVSLEFDDIVISASKSLPPSISNRLTNWDLVNCVAFRKEFLAGFVTELYQRDFRESFPDAKAKMDNAIEDAIREDIGGDDQRIISQNTDYKDLMFKHLLLPVWVSAYKHKEKTYQFVVNGRTGQVVGLYPKSVGKIILVVLAIIAIISMILMI